jgi:hypothetical protein
MPTEYFEQRERALLGQRYEQLYAALQQTAEGGFSAGALALLQGGFCGASAGF